jgi:hypothetical protein
MGFERRLTHRAMLVEFAPQVGVETPIADPRAETPEQPGHEALPFQSKDDGSMNGPRPEVNSHRLSMEEGPTGEDQSG